MFNNGCSYEHTHPNSSIHIEFENQSANELLKVVETFAESYSLQVRDESKNFPSGLNSILYELVNGDGQRLIKINDLMDGKRFVISSYEANGVDVQGLFKSLLGVLENSFPESAIEIRQDAN